MRRRREITLSLKQPPPKIIEARFALQKKDGKNLMAHFNSRSTLGYLLVLLGTSLSLLLGVESGRYRLLSITQSVKLILVSQIPNKTKYILDASTTKITVDGKPAEFTDLKAFTVVNVKFEAKKGTKEGVDIDGIATEITISTPENPK
jgi:hypothetical protein